MIDIKFLRENPDAVKENIKKKFQDSKLPLVDEVIELDAQLRKAQQRGDSLRADRNRISKEIGGFMAKGQKDEAEKAKAQVKEFSDELEALEKQEEELSEKVKKIMMTIPNIIDPSVPIGKDDSENVEITRYGEPVVPDFEIPYHSEIMERLNGIDLAILHRAEKQFHGSDSSTLLTEKLHCQPCYCVLPDGICDCIYRNAAVYRCAGSFFPVFC